MVSEHNYDESQEDSRTVILPAVDKHNACNGYEAQREPVRSRETNVRLYIHRGEPGQRADVANPEKYESL